LVYYETQKATDCCPESQLHHQKRKTKVKEFRAMVKYGKIPKDLEGEMRKPFRSSVVGRLEILISGFVESYVSTWQID
jgi:hypothetical protein